MTPNTSIQRQYDELVAAIVKAVPEIEILPLGICHCKECKRIDYRTITLEDVLRAIPPFAVRVCSGTGQLVDHTKSYEGVTTCSWHLGHDLAWHKENAPETITFLHSLLCK